MATTRGGVAVVTNADIWGGLAAKAGKREVYARDPYFLETWADATDVWGARAVPMLRDIAVLILKPETVVTRRMGTALAFLRERGFVPVMCEPVRYTRHMNRAAWRYQYQTDDMPTADRLAVNDLLLSATDSLALILRDTAPVPGQAASVWLNTYKGSMTPANRSGDTPSLRSLVAGPNRMMSGVHIPDEPADVVRELGILFDRPERHALMCAVVATDDVTAAVEAAIAALYARTETVTLDPAAALARLSAAITVQERATDGRDAAGAALGALRAITAAVHRGEPLPWQPFLAALAGAGITLPLWDRILLGTEYIRHRAPVPSL